MCSHLSHIYREMLAFHGYNRMASQTILWGNIALSSTSEQNLSDQPGLPSSERTIQKRLSGQNLKWLLGHLQLQSQNLKIKCLVPEKWLRERGSGVYIPHCRKWGELVPLKRQFTESRCWVRSQLSNKKKEAQGEGWDIWILCGTKVSPSTQDPDAESSLKGRWLAE